VKIFEEKQNNFFYLKLKTVAEQNKLKNKLKTEEIFSFVSGKKFFSVQEVI
jgi:hypothetical protein